MQLDNFVYTIFICWFPERLINFTTHPTREKKGKEIYNGFNIGFQIILHIMPASNYNWLTRFYTLG